MIASEGDEFPVGALIAWLVADGETAPKIEAAVEVKEPETFLESVQSESPAATPLAKVIAANEGVDLESVASGHDKIRKEDVLYHLNSPPASSVVLASPKAKRLGKEASVELANLTGSGPGGAIVAADVVAARRLRQSAPHETSRMWQVMAKRLTESWQTVPHFYLTYDANAEGLNTWYRSLKSRSDKLTVTDLITKVVAQALSMHPQVNASWRNQAVSANDSINVGLAVAVEDGLVVPVIQAADEKSIGELTDLRRSLIDKAHSGDLRPDDFANGTFTISNLGMLGVREFSAIVNPPQAAILAVGRSEDRAVVEDGRLVVRNQMTLTLSCDHRVVDGAIGARFMQTLVSLIESPAQLIR